MVNITKSNFIEKSNDFLQHLPEADFVALDEEMTGISMVNSDRPRKDQTPSDRYAQLKLVPERYSIIQLGLALHKGRQVRKYNFYMFPNEATTASSEIVLNPSTVKFLHQHGMSFDVWSKYGISYCTQRHVLQATQKYLQTEQEVAAGDPSNNLNSTCTIQETLTRRVELRRSEDIDFFARSMASLREWLDGASTTTPGQGQANPIEDDDNNNHHHQNTNVHQFLLPPCNSFLRRALYENISKEYPSLILEKVVPTDPSFVGGGNNNHYPHHHQIRVLRLTAAELRERRERLQSERWNHYIVEKVGMWRIVEALRHACHGQSLDRTHPLFAASADQVEIQLHNNTNNNYNPSPCLIRRRQRPIPLVVHNGWMDLLFLMTHFDDNTRPTLPDSLSDCKRLVQSYFPSIFDTKVLSTEYCGYAEMNLGNLYQMAGDKGLEIVTSVTASTYDSSSLLEQQANGGAGDGAEHEASYDAYMTGAIFIGLSRHLKPIVHDQEEESEEEEGEVVVCADDDQENNGAAVGGIGGSRRGPRQRPAHWFESTLGRNRIYHLGLFTLDLESPDSDPLSKGMLLECSYRVTGIDPSVTTRDIVWCLNQLVDSDNRPVNFDIVWVDDTTFIVATRYRPGNAATIGSLGETTVASSSEEEASDAEDTFILKSHGQLIHRALSLRFGKDGIATLEEHFRLVRASSEAAAAKRNQGWFSRLLEFTHLGSLKRMLVNDSSENERRTKRPRQK